MAVSALAWMATLIALRLVNVRKTVRRKADRAAVERALIGVMQGKGDANALQPYRQRARLIAETLLDFIGIVRGQDRQAVVDALESLGADRILRARVTRGSLAGRLASIEALGVFPGAETQHVLLRASDRGPQGLRLAALRSLRQAGGEVRASDVLQRVGAQRLRPSGGVAEFLRELVADDPAWAAAALSGETLAAEPRLMLLEALGEAGAYEAIPVFTTYAASECPRMRAAAVTGLGKLMHPAGEACIRSALDDSEWEVRSAAAKAAGDARLAGLLDPLAMRLADEVWRVRHQAAHALAKLGPGGRQRLEAAAGSGGGGVAARAASLALAEAIT
ncbi:HEAT repeat domain-containing protein [Phenylobacterium sp.]|jgi:HEAT repeat protein|uniref:HEAT repeat domain-containing protein n=1 Tax=Phenylobacterium sp. TaxID=1871053 RepID=UPI002F95FCC6